MRRHLEAFIPASADEEDLRGFEWHHYWGLMQGSRLTLLGHTSEVRSLAEKHGIALAKATRPEDVVSKTQLETLGAVMIEASEFYCRSLVESFTGGF